MRAQDCINAKLSNDLGNLAYRTLSFAHKHCGGVRPAPGALTAADEEMLGAARELLPKLRELTDELLLHRVTQQTNALVQQANRYIDTQAPWALRKSDPPRMETVLWVLMEVMRHVGVLSQPITPTIASRLLDQLGVPSDGGARTFEALEGRPSPLVGGEPMPQPEIIVPRYEPPEGEAEAAAAAAAGATEEAAAAASSAAALSADELAELEAQIKEQGERVRAAKGGGGDKAAVEEAVGALLALKARLPEGHELLATGKKQKKKKKKAEAA